MAVLDKFSSASSSFSIKQLTTDSKTQQVTREPAGKQSQSAVIRPHRVVVPWFFRVVQQIEFAAFSVFLVEIIVAHFLTCF